MESERVLSAFGLARQCASDDAPDSCFDFSKNRRAVEFFVKVVAPEEDVDRLESNGSLHARDGELDFSVRGYAFHFPLPVDFEGPSWAMDVPKDVEDFAFRLPDAAPGPVDGDPHWDDDVAVTVDDSGMSVTFTELYGVDYISSAVYYFQIYDGKCEPRKDVGGNEVLVCDFKSHKKAEDLKEFCDDAKSHTWSVEKFVCRVKDGEIHLETNAVDLDSMESILYQVGKEVWDDHGYWQPVVDVDTARCLGLRPEDVHLYEELWDSEGTCCGDDYYSRVTVRMDGNPYRIALNGSKNNC